MVITFISTSFHTHLLVFFYGVFTSFFSRRLYWSPFLERLRSADRKRSVRWRRPSTSMSWPGWETTSRSSDQCTETIGTYTHKTRQSSFPSALRARSDLVWHGMALSLSRTGETSYICITLCNFIDSSFSRQYCSYGRAYCFTWCYVRCRGSTCNNMVSYFIHSLLHSVSDQATMERSSSRNSTPMVSQECHWAKWKPWTSSQQPSLSI